MAIYSLQFYRPARLNNQPSDYPYTLKVSARARRVRLTVKPYQGLEVVIPKSFPRRQVARILQQHHDWITSRLAKYQSSLAPAARPESVLLRLVDREFTIHYSQADRPRCSEQDHRLLIACDDNRQVIHLLRGWVREQGKRVLPNRLQVIANRTGLHYRKCIVRSQKTRWGSCSSAGTISLNDQLLFLPPANVDYLMLHELCHTRHMNHSADFWNLVAAFEPDYQSLEKCLNADRERVPDWFKQSLYS